MVLNATINNISVISWCSVLLVEKSRVPEKTTDLPQVTDKLYEFIGQFKQWKNIMYNNICRESQC